MVYQQAISKARYNNIIAIDKMRYWIALAVFMLFGIACKSKKQLADKEPVINDVVSATANPNDSIRLNVAFNSPGSGINGQALKQLKGYIERFETDNNLTLTYYQIPWGREGEVDFCFKLSTIDSKKAEEFVTGVKNLIGKADRVTMKENCNCRNLPQR